MGQTFKWLKQFGGLKAMAEYNTQKANVLYNHLDSTEVWRNGIRTRLENEQSSWLVHSGASFLPTWRGLTKS
jgi:phosphoserine aminotransferase